MSDTQHKGDGDGLERAPGERAARYRALADRHLSLARTSKVAEVLASHLELAALWTRLAAQAEPREARDADAEERLKV